MDEIIKVLNKSALAGNGAIQDTRTGLMLRHKGYKEIVTNCDIASENAITDVLQKEYPASAIYSEEVGNISGTEELLFIIDPIDGTHNFIRNIDIFGVSIGVVHKQSDFVAGVIYMPKSDELYVAEKGSGAYKNGVKISVSDRDDLKECSVSFDSSIRYNPGPMLATLGDLANQVFNLRMFGSSARQLSP